MAVGRPLQSLASAARPHTVRSGSRDDPLPSSTSITVLRPLRAGAPELRAVREVRPEGDLSSVPEQPSSVSMAVTMPAVRTTWASPSEVMVWPNLPNLPVLSPLNRDRVDMGVVVPHHTDVLTKILTSRLGKTWCSCQTRRSPPIHDGVSEGIRTPDTQDHNLVL